MPAHKKITPAVVEQIYAALRGGADMGMAARAAGVTRQALYNRQDGDKEFKIGCVEARNFADEKVIKSLFLSAVSGNTTAMVFWLKNRKRHEWRDRHELNIGGTDDGTPIRFDIKLADGSSLPAPITPISDGDADEHGS